ncbi:MAG: serine hydrolase [candidate division Zixibacteria bacterium]|nr:serine hydrolase [candidate division Zixibacteria bacterium]
MLSHKTLPRVLLLLAAFVFFSANTVYFLEDPDGPLSAATVDGMYHFDFETAAQKGPHLNLKSAILVNYDNGDVLYAKNAETVRPIASITKLVTAMVVLDNGIDLQKTEIITKEDAHRSSKSRLRVGYEMTLLDLLYAALMNSDNRAARALARATSGSIEAFAKEMNYKARQLNLRKTEFYEPTGLDQRNVSTAHEVAKILHYAYDYELIKKITSQQKPHMCQVVNRKRTKKQMANTNLLIHSKYKVLSGKTGYIRAADYCLTTLVKNKQGERLTAVVLGVPGDRLRFKECRRLIDWGYRDLQRRATLASN